MIKRGILIALCGCMMLLGCGGEGNSADPISGTSPTAISTTGDEIEATPTLSLFPVETDSVDLDNLPMEIDPQIAHAIQDKDSILFLDVRADFEYSEGYIGTQNLHIPISELRDRYEEVPTDKSIIIYSGSHGGGLLGYNFLTEQGYTNLHVLTNGSTGWQMSGFTFNNE